MKAALRGKQIHILEGSKTYWRHWIKFLRFFRMKNIPTPGLVYSSHVLKHSCCSLLDNSSKARINFHTCKTHFLFLQFALLALRLLPAVEQIFSKFSLSYFSSISFCGSHFFHMQIFVSVLFPKQCRNLSRPRNAISRHFYYSITRCYFLTLFIAFAVPSNIALQLKHSHIYASYTSLLWTVSCQRKCQK